jgi:hypothetical protein
MAKAATLTFDIIAVADKAIETVDKVKEKVTGAHTAMKVAAVAGAGAILGALGEATNAAAEHETAVAKLAQAYKNAGVPQEGMKESLEAIDKSSRKTGQSADDNVAAYTKLIAATHNATTAHKDLATAQDLAAFKGTDVATAADDIVKASTGSTRALKEMGIATTDASGKQLTGAALMNKLTEAVHGQADAMGQTASGQMARYKESIDQAKVAVGEAFLPALKGLLSMLQPVFTWLSNNTAIIKVLAPIIGILAGLIMAVVGAMRLWAIIQGILNAVMDANPIGLIIAGIALLVVGIMVAYNKFQPFRQIVQDVWSALRTFGDWIAQHWQLIVDLLLGPVGVIITNLSTVKQIIRDVISALGDIGHAVSTALGWLKKIPGGSIISKLNPFSASAPAGPASSTVIVQVTATPGDDLPEVVYQALRTYQRRHVRPELRPLFAGR